MMPETWWVNLKWINIFTCVIRCFFLLLPWKQIYVARKKRFSITSRITCKNVFLILKNKIKHQKFCIHDPLYYIYWTKITTEYTNKCSVVSILFIISMNKVSNLSAINKSQLQLNIHHRINVFQKYLSHYVYLHCFVLDAWFSNTGDLYYCASNVSKKLCVNSAPEIAKLTAGLPYWLFVNTHQPRRVHHSILFDIPLRNCARTTAASWLNGFRGNRICIQFHDTRFPRPITIIRIRYVFPLKNKRTSTFSVLSFQSF